MSKNTNLSFLTDYITADITNGRIGINTPSPTVAFDVTGVANFSSSITAAKIITSTTLDGDPQLGVFTNASTGTSAEATIYIRNGTTSNDATFLQTLGTGFTTTGGFVQDGGTLGTGTGLSGGLSLIVRANADMRFYTNGHTNERMRITSAGNVGIGTTTPSQKLEVNGTIRAAGAFVQATGNLFVGDWTGFYDVSTSTSKVYLLQLVPTETIPLLNYRLFGVIQTNTVSGTYYFTSIASQTMEVRFVGNVIQARITNGNGYYFNWSITQLC